jgi:hypothetical protein
MKRASSLFLLALTTVLVAGCGGDDPVEPDVVTIADLVGSWTASSVLHTDKANPAQSFDIVASGGETRTTVLQGGGARTWVTLGTFSDEWDAQLAMNGNTLTSTPAEASRGVRSYTFALVGNILTLTTDNASFDFTLSEAAGVPTTEVTVFVRQ